MSATAEAPTTAESAAETFSERLKAATWGDHATAEHHGFTKALLDGELSREGYTAMVAQHYFAYAALDEETQAAVDDPPAGVEASEVLTAALQSLTPEDRAAVELYVIEELSAQDIARILRLPTAKAVYNRVYRALAALRGELERAGMDPLTDHTATDIDPEAK